MSSLKHHESGLQYWRSLEQLAEAPAVRDALGKEFPGYDADTMASTSRRRFLKIMGAAMALAGVTLNGCRRWPRETLAPYAANPRDRMPGVPEQYATVMELAGVAAGLLVTSYDGRPVKIEGNPSHPFASTFGGKLGSADALAQASVLEMYDPERSRTVIDRTSGEAKPSTWEAFAAAAGQILTNIKSSNGGAGLAVLCEATASPSVADMRARLLAAYPQAKWYEYEPLSADAELAGAKLAFGKAVRPRLFLDKASIVLSLDADLLGAHPGHVRYGNDWSQRRRSADNAAKREMSRVYVAESGFTITGSVADHRLPIDCGRVELVARAIAANVGVAGVTSDAKLTDAEVKFVESVSKDLKAAGKDGVVAAGAHATPAVHALAFAINQQLGAVGNTVALLELPDADRAPHAQQVTDLAKAMAGGQVGALLILGGNPAYDAPADAQFGAALAKVPATIHLSLYDNETSKACKWHLPRGHYLESWGDARGFDGTLSVVQPLIEPLYGGKSIIETLALLTNDPVTGGMQIVRRTWAQFIKSDFEHGYRKALEAGLLAGSGYKPASVKLQALNLPAPAAAPAGMFLRFEPDATVYDGRFANNGWLQETGKPLSKLTWDNAAMLSVKDATAMGVVLGDMVRLESPGVPAMEVPAYVLPGQPVGVVSVSVGYGRTAAGHVGDNLGFNAYALRTVAAPYAAAGVKVTKAAGSYVLATTHTHHIIDEIGMKGREVRVGEKHQAGSIIDEKTFREFVAEVENKAGAPRVIPLPLAPGQGAEEDEGRQLFAPPSRFNSPHAWGMSVDMTACIGCNACLLACQSENNIPVVGKEQVLKHREMNWIRIDTYLKGDPADPDVETVHQPMMCVHCENAPCEQVCPVAATVHDTEGLNTMVYNRCIGTRYCSNNCPYKVRRFNYFDFHSQDPRNTGKAWLGMPDTQQVEQIDQIKRMVFNPEVTVRMRGVMEKCTYCTQRIHNTVIAKRNQGQDVSDGDIVTACQQACPTEAIVFGNLNERDAAVTKHHQNPRAYGVLDEELNTRPRTKYLAKLWNPAGDGEHEAHG